MRRTSFRQPLPPALAPLLAKGYPAPDGPAEPFEYLYVAPAGALSASGADIGRFMRAHLAGGGALLRPATARAMQDYRGPGTGPINRMALGFYEQRANGHRAITHGGDTNSFHSQLWLFPDADLGLFIALNGTGRDRAAGPLRHAVFHRFADRYLPGPDPQGRVDAATARRHGRALAGRYLSSRSGFTSFVGIARLIGQVTITADDAGKIAVPALDWLSAKPRDWVEIAPWVWMDRGTGERLAAEVRDGRVVAFGFDPVPPVTWLRVPAGIDGAWLLPALGAALLLIMVAALAWPARALIRRHYRAPAPFSPQTLVSYRLTRLLAWACLAAVAGWMVLVARFLTDPDSRGGSLDWLLNGLRLLTPLATFGLAAASAWHLARCRREGRRWTAQASAALLLVAALVLAWVALSFHLYGFDMVY